MIVDQPVARHLIQDKKILGILVHFPKERSTRIQPALSTNSISRDVLRTSRYIPEIRRQALFAWYRSDKNGTASSFFHPIVENMVEKQKSHQISLKAFPV